MSEAIHDSVRWGHTLIRFDYRFSQRRTLAISVHPDLRVEVIAPSGTHIDAIHEKVLKRAPWIEKSKRAFELLLPIATPRSYVNGESHYYLGRRYRLRAETGEENGVKLLRGRLHVSLQNKYKSKKVKQLVDAWYRKRAAILFAERLELLLITARRECISKPRFQIRTMITRWGSCSPSGLITLNPLLLRAPKECIDYVIAHELCHLKEPHHGPRFWRLLERIMFDYRDKRAKLQKFSQLIAQ